MVKVGQLVQFDPFKEITGFASGDCRGQNVTGAVVYVNAPHKWFSVEYELKGVKQRTSFKFCDIGEAVTGCG